MTLLSCRETSLMVARSEYEEATGLAKALAWLHLLYCRHCRRFRRQIRLLGEAARLWAGNPRRDGFEEELVARLTGPR